MDLTASEGVNGRGTVRNEGGPEGIERQGTTGCRGTWALSLSLIVDCILIRFDSYARIYVIFSW